MYARARVDVRTCHRQSSETGSLVVHKGCVTSARRQGDTKSRLRYGWWWGGRYLGTMSARLNFIDDGYTPPAEESHDHGITKRERGVSCSGVVGSKHIVQHDKTS